MKFHNVYTIIVLKGYIMLSKCYCKIYVTYGTVFINWWRETETTSAKTFGNNGKKL